MMRRPTKTPTCLMLINAEQPEEIRVAIIRKNRLDEFYIERITQEQTRGNIYKGIVYDIVPSLQAVFVEYGAANVAFCR